MARMAIAAFCRRTDAWAVLLLVSVPLLPAWGAYLGDVALNSDLDGAERARWLITLYLLPWSMTLYWHLHVRGCRPDLS